MGISQNELIEQAIEHEVVARGAMLSDDLRAAANRLAELTQEQYERIQARGLESYVAGEALLDPVQARAAQQTAGVDSARVDRPSRTWDVATIYSSARAGLA
jgi:hypothetical protein